jgi:hypothetical protein
MKVSVSWWTMVLLGVVFWAVGAASRRHGLTGEAAPYQQGMASPVRSEGSQPWSAKTVSARADL